MCCTYLWTEFFLTENEDFSPAINRELVFVQTSTVCSTISVQNDETFENEEAFYFAFSNAFSQERISVDTSRVSVTIQDDDGMHAAC